MRLSLVLERPLQLGETPFEQLQPAADLTGRLLAPAGELDPCLLAAAGELVARSPSAPDDLVDQLGGPAAGLGGRAGGCLHRPLDRGAQRVGDPALAGSIVGVRGCAGARVGFAHPTAQHNPRPLTTYLRPTAEIAADAIVVGDPRTAMLLAQELTTGPVMANHSYGLWGYTGLGRGERPLTVQSTGLGGAATALVVAELAALGTARVIGLREVASARGETAIVVEAAAGRDGTTRSLGFDGRVTPDRELSRALLASAGATAIGGLVVSVDPGGETAGEDAARELGALVVDYETAALLAAARSAGIAAAAMLIPRATPTRGAPDDLPAALLDLGRLAAALLAA